MPRTPRYWTPEEDVILRKAMSTCTEGDIVNWCRIAAQLPGRTNKDCRKRWHNAVAAGLNKGQWTKDEDERLRRGVREHGLKKWPQVADVVRSRSADQCAKRWHQSLNPELDHSEWTANENERLLQAVKTLGRQWTLIQGLHFQGRSKNAIKNRYSVLTRKTQSSRQTSPGKARSSSGSIASTGRSSRAPSQAGDPLCNDDDDGDDDDGTNGDDEDLNDFPDRHHAPLNLGMPPAEPHGLNSDVGMKDFFMDGNLLWGVDSGSDFALSSGSPDTSLLGFGMPEGDVTFDATTDVVLAADGTAFPSHEAKSGRLDSFGSNAPFSSSSPSSTTDHSNTLFSLGGGGGNDLMQIERPLSPCKGGNAPTRAHFTLTIQQPSASVTQSLMQIAIETHAKFRIQWE